MDNAWGIFYADLPYLVAAFIITALGALLWANQKGSLLKAISGGLLIAVGGLAALNAFYFDGFRWLNPIVGVALVIVIGVGLIRQSGGWISSLIGGIVVIAGTLYISDLYPLNQVDFSGSLGRAFEQGLDRFVDILQGDTPRGGRNGRAG